MLKVLARGAAWMIAFRLAERSLGLISTLILARLLTPHDFGLVAMAMSVIAMIELVGAFGFDNALIQLSKPERRHYDTAFTLNAGLGLVAGGLMAALAPLAAAFYSEPRLVDVMLVLSFAWAAQGLENVGTVDFRRGLDFRREFLFLTSKRIASFIVTIIAAYTMRSYWALVIGTVTGRVAMVLLSYVYHPYRPRLNLSALRDLMSFSVWLLFNNSLGFINSRLSSFVIGRASGSHALGLYTIAYEIGTLPTSELLAPVNRAIFPSFAKLVGGDARELHEGFLSVIAATTLFAIPAAFGIAAVADPLVRVVLGESWLETIPLLQVLGFLGAVAAITSCAYPMYLALGRSRTTTLLSGAAAATLIPTMLLLARSHGALGVAWAALGVAVAFLPISLSVLMRALQISIGEFFGRVWRPVVASTAMFVVVRQFMGLVNHEASALGWLLLLLECIAIGALSYIASIALLWKVFGRGKGVEAHLVRWLNARRQQAAT